MPDRLLAYRLRNFSSSRFLPWILDKKIIMSDKSKVLLNGTVKKGNCHFDATENPPEIKEVPHSRKFDLSFLNYLVIEVILWFSLIYFLMHFKLYLNYLNIRYCVFNL